MHSKITYSFSSSPAAGRKLPLQGLSEENRATPKKQVSRPNKEKYCETPFTYEIKSNARVHHWTYSRNTSPNDYSYRDESHQEQQEYYHHQRIVSPSSPRCEHDGIFPAYAGSSSFCEYSAEEEPSTPPTGRSFPPRSLVLYHTSAVGGLVTPDYTPSAANILPPDEADWLRVANIMLKTEVPDHHTSSNPHLQQPNLRPNDIVCGRGAPTNFHPGNQILRELVKKDYQTSYLCARRSEKPIIAIELLGAIRSRGGRFVRRSKTTGRSFSWVEIGEKAAYEKVCQYLRDGAPEELRRQILAAATAGALKQTGERGISAGSITTRYDDNKENW